MILIKLVNLLFSGLYVAPFMLVFCVINCLSSIRHVTCFVTQIVSFKLGAVQGRI